MFEDMKFTMCVSPDADLPTCLDWWKEIERLGYDYIGIPDTPMLMREALHARAAVLPERGGAYAEFADDTDHALASGCEGAALALVERSLDKAAGLLGAPPALWLHGGGADALRGRLPPHRWVADAVLRGLARWQAHAFA